MDIWDWVEETQKKLIEQGNHRLADFIDRLPSYTVDEEHEQVDAIVPEALALTKSIKNPWLEIFIRHWNLQSKVVHRNEVTDMLPEALNLLEFSNREETRNCPQSICVVQDIAICYELLDGPGYVEERLIVAEEVLDKIDATWPCFSCISSEYANALDDGKRYEEAFNFLEQQMQKLLLANQYEDRFHMRGIIVEVLINLQRYEEAYEFNQEAFSLGGGESFLIDKELDNTRLLAYLGRYEEAKKSLIDFPKIKDTSDFYLNWAETALLLVDADIIPNDWQLNAKFQQMGDKLSQNGVLRKAFTITLWQTKLALKRKRINIAKRCCDRAEALIFRLRKPLDAPQLLADIRSQIISQDQQSINSYETPEQVLENLGNDPELAVEILDNARQFWPEHEELILATAKGYNKIGESQYSLDILKQYLDNYPDSPTVLLTYGFLLIETKQYTELLDFFSAALERELTKKSHAIFHWILALQYHKTNEIELAKQHLSTLITQKPDAVNARTLLAQLERETDNLETALQHLDWLVENNEESGQYDWNRMVIATILEDWDKVIHSAKRLGFENLPKTGPIEQEWGTCKILFREEDVEPIYAMRTGPVTAKILEIAYSENIQHYNDIVIFEPTTVNESNETESHNYPIYELIKIIKTGKYISYTLDGVHPGEEKLQQLKDNLVSLRCACQIQSGEDYQLSLDENSEDLLGIYAYIAVPETQDLQEVADLLATTTQDYIHPLVWPELVENIGNKKELERQMAIVEKYEL